MAGWTCLCLNHQGPEWCTHIMKVKAWVTVHFSSSSTPRPFPFTAPGGLLSWSLRTRMSPQSAARSGQDFVGGGSLQQSSNLAPWDICPLLLLAYLQTVYFCLVFSLFLSETILLCYMLASHSWTPAFSSAPPPHTHSRTTQGPAVSLLSGRGLWKLERQSASQTYLFLS